MSFLKEFWDLIMLVGLIIFRHEMAIVSLKNMDLHWFWTYLIVAPLSSTISLSVYGFFSFGPARQWVQDVNKRVRAFWLKWRLTRKIIISHDSFTASLYFKKQKRVDVIARTIERGGKIMIFLIPIIPLPLSRSGTVLATRILGTQKAMRLILTAIAIRVAGEVGLYYWKGEKLLPFLKNFSVIQITGLVIGIFLAIYLISWLIHSIRDGHWKAGRFDESEAQS